MKVNLSWVPPSGAWDFQVTFTATGGFSQTYIVSSWHADGTVQYESMGGADLTIFPVTSGTTYTVSVKVNRVAPPGTRSWSSSTTSITVTPTNTAPGIVLYVRNIGGEGVPNTIYLIATGVGASSYPATGTVSMTGAGGYSRTEPLSLTLAAPEQPVRFDDLVPGTLYTVTAVVTGLGTTTRTYYCPTPQNQFGEITTSGTSATLTWTNPAGSSVAASNVFQTVMLYNYTSQTWISSQKPAIGTPTVTVSGLVAGNEYWLYCFPVNSTGLGSETLHRVTFIAGSDGTAAQFGINGWFYSPVPIG